jgi:hypothetical protein
LFLKKHKIINFKLFFFNKKGYHQSNGQQNIYFESLEQFHVFLLAHILQRPIIIVADQVLRDLNGAPMAPIKFGGIYLPFECNPKRCHRFPLVMAYDSAHFSALLLLDEYADAELYQQQRQQASPSDINKKLQTQAPYSIIPVTYANKELMPIHFGYDPGEAYDWSRFPAKPEHDQANGFGEYNSNERTYDTSNRNSGTAASTPEEPRGGQKELVELTIYERMSLLQRYMDLVKVELSEPGALSKRGQFVANSSGMKVSIHNVRSLSNQPNSLIVGERLLNNTEMLMANGANAKSYPKNGSTTTSGSNNSSSGSNVKSNLNKGIKKFMKIFKKSGSEDASSDGHQHASYYENNNESDFVKKNATMARTGSRQNYDHVDNRKSSTEDDFVSAQSGKLLFNSWSICMIFGQFES